MLSSDDEQKHSMDNAASTSNLVEDGEVWRQVLREMPSHETPEEKRDQSILHDAKDIDQHSETCINQQAHKGSDGRQINMAENGGYPTANSTEIKTPPICDETTSEETLNAQEYSGQAEEYEPRVSHDSLRDINSSSRPNTQESTQIGSIFARFESSSDFRKPSIESLRITPTKTLEPRNSLENESIKTHRNNTVPNELFSDNMSSTAREKDEKVDPSQQPGELEPEHPGSIALTFLMIGLCLSVFLISLDRTIVTTAIPYISGEFHSYADVGWYGSAYLLTACAFQPMYGRIFTLFSIKWSYLAANMMFEIGSLICGIAPNSLCLIIGRAIAGVGSAGILTGSFVVIAHSVPMHKRPVFTAAVGLMFGVGATVGPLMGGVFTDEVTWRWCFYFNLPVGGATILAMMVFFNPKKNMNTKRSFGSRLLELDIIGNILLLGACVMLFIAFQYTEVGDSWASSKVIGLLVGFAVTIIIFGFWLWYRGDKALVPLDTLKQRSVAASCLFSFFIYSALILHGYYLPQWFQAVKNTSAITSGVDMIPYVVCNAFFSLLAGIVVSKTGYFTPPSIIGTAMATIGCGLISTLNTNTTTSQWIGYEILSAAGFGIAIQQGFTAVQTVLPLDKIPIGTAAVVASQSFGGAIFVSVGNTILQNEVKSSSMSGQLPGIDIQAVLDAGATGFRSVVTADQLPALLEAYNGALQKVFIAAIPVIGLAFISSLFLEWKSVKPQESTEQV